MNQPQQDEQELAEFDRQEPEGKFFTDMKNTCRESQLQALEDKQTLPEQQHIDMMAQ